MNHTSYYIHTIFTILIHSFHDLTNCKPHFSIHSCNICFLFFNLDLVWSKQCSEARKKFTF